MAKKGPNRPKQRILLPNGMWIVFYKDNPDEIKISGYDIRLEVTDLGNWGGEDGGSDVYLRRVPRKPQVRQPVAQGDDMICVARDT